MCTIGNLVVLAFLLIVFPLYRFLALFYFPVLFYFMLLLVIMLWPLWFVWFPFGPNLCVVDMYVTLAFRSRRKNGPNYYVVNECVSYGFSAEEDEQEVLPL
jgi:hypothetical protein